MSSDPSHPPSPSPSDPDPSLSDAAHPRPRPNDSPASGSEPSALESVSEPGSDEGSSVGGRSRPSGLKKKKKKQKKRYATLNAYLWHEWVKPLGTILIVLGTFRSALLDWNDVPSGSMEPEVMTGDRIGVDKRAFGFHIPFTKDQWIGGRWGKPHRGDIVVAYSPDPNDQVRIVKRVVGVPGDTVEVRDGRIVLNGELLEYREADPDTDASYLTVFDRTEGEFYTEMLPTDDPDDDDGFRPHTVMFWPGNPQNRELAPVTLGDDEYFFMGDNRDQSKDGRSYGKCSGDRIVGRAIGVAFSLNHDNFYIPRVSRFFSGIR